MLRASHWFLIFASGLLCELCHSVPDPSTRTLWPPYCHDCVGPAFCQVCKWQVLCMELYGIRHQEIV